MSATRWLSVATFMASTVRLASQGTGIARGLAFSIGVCDVSITHTLAAPPDSPATHKPFTESYDGLVRSLPNLASVKCRSHCQRARSARSPPIPAISGPFHDRAREIHPVGILGSMELAGRLGGLGGRSWSRGGSEGTRVRSLPAGGSAGSPEGEVADW